jgi:hypothetical protein
MSIQFISTIGSLLIGLSGIGATIWINLKVLRQKNRDDERKEIYKKLNDFYSPFIQLRNKSQELYNIFIKNRVNDTLTLEMLLNNQKLSENDKVILDEIISLGQKCEDLILEKAGLVDDEAFRQDVLPAAATHYFVIRMAYQKLLQGESERFIKYKFPNELDEWLDGKTQELKDRLEVLNR